MSLHHSLAAALWLATAVGAYSLVALWANDAQSGKLQPWVLVIGFWAAALASVAIHHLSRYLSECLTEGEDALKRALARLQPVIDQHAAAMSARIAQVADALQLGWAMHGAAVLPRARVVADRFAQALDVIKGLRTRHKAAAG